MKILQTAQFSPFIYASLSSIINKMKLIPFFVILLLILGYLIFSYIRIYHYAGAVMLKIPYETNSFTLENPRGQGSIQYVALGDSLSVGLGSLNVKETFVYQYALKLSEKYTKVSVINLGRSGATTKDLINSQLPQALSQNPDYITLLIGINDVHAKITTDDFQKNYHYILGELINKTQAQITVINLPYLGSNKLITPPFSTILDFRTKQFNGIISDAISSNRIKLVDLYEKSYQVFNQDPKYYSSDLFHPSAEGYMLWSKIINAY
ncbi:MAG: SGNH/GDSL hydrolase family protein [bacterium]|nr:SGNH/GDSL hydrolase family protein [bacterium]